jgi:hypothetical protein
MAPSVDPAKEIPDKSSSTPNRSCKATLSACSPARPVSNKVPSMSKRSSFLRMGSEEVKPQCTLQQQKIRKKQKRAVLFRRQLVSHQDPA